MTFRGFAVHLNGSTVNFVKFRVPDTSNVLPFAIGAAEAIVLNNGAHFYTLIDEDGETVLEGARPDLQIEENDG